MNIREYAEDVGLEVSEIIQLCKELDIKKSKEDDFLNDEEITILDNEISNQKVNENPDYELDEELEEKVSNLVSSIDIDLDEVTTKPEKLKKQDNKNQLNKQTNKEVIPIPGDGHCYVHKMPCTRHCSPP